MTFTEVDDSFDGETFFLYVLLAAVGLLIVFGLNYAFSSSKVSDLIGTLSKSWIDFLYYPACMISPY